MFNFIDKNTNAQAAIASGSIDQLQENGSETVIRLKKGNRVYESTEDIVTLYNRNIPQDMILVTSLGGVKFAYSMESISQVRADGTGSEIQFASGAGKTSKVVVQESPTAIISAASSTSGDNITQFIVHPDQATDPTKAHTIRIVLASGTTFDLDLSAILGVSDATNTVTDPGTVWSPTFAIADDTVCVYKVDVVGVDGNTGDIWAHEFRGVVKNVAGTATHVDTTTDEMLAEEGVTTSWTDGAANEPVTVGASGSDLVVTITNPAELLAGDTVDWCVKLTKEKQIAL